MPGLQSHRLSFFKLRTTIPLNQVKSSTRKCLLQERQPKSRFTRLMAKPILMVTASRGSEVQFGLTTCLDLSKKTALQLPVSKFILPNGSRTGPVPELIGVFPLLRTKRL